MTAARYTVAFVDGSEQIIEASGGGEVHSSGALILHIDGEGTTLLVAPHAYTFAKQEVIQ